MKDTQQQLSKISILIPVFNRKEYIVECIQSALNQTYTDFEVVIVDNVSHDGTWEICQQFARLDQRVRIFRNDSNIGPVRNWMRCAKEARGEYSKILFSDDCLDPNCLTEMYAKLNDPDIAFVYCSAKIGSSKEVASVAYYLPGESRLSRNEYLNRLLRNEAPVSPGAILIRTSDLNKNLKCEFSTSTLRPFEKHGAGPDLMISLLTMIDYKYVISIAEPLVFFRSHKDSFTTTDVNGEVTNGYRSVIGLFLKNNFSKKILINYLSFIWLQQMFVNRKWTNPVKIILEYEGKGSFDEIFMVIKFSSYHLINKMMDKKISFVPRK